MKENVIELEVMNFEKYNPRKDRHKHHYFRLENKIWDDEKIYSLSATQKLCFIFIISQVNEYRNTHESTTNQVRINIKSMWNQLGVKPNHIRIAISCLEQNQLVKILSGNQSLTTDSPIDKIREEKKEIYKESSMPSPKAPKFDLDLVYKEYPKKIGKTKAFSKLKAQIKTEDDYKNLKIAVFNYKAYIDFHKTEYQYIKHFSTFVTSWQDWIRPEA